MEGRKEDSEVLREKMQPWLAAFVAVGIIQLAWGLVEAQKHISGQGVLIWKRADQTETAIRALERALRQIKIRQQAIDNQGRKIKGLEKEKQDALELVAAQHVALLHAKSIIGRQAAEIERRDAYIHALKRELDKLLEIDETDEWPQEEETQVAAQ